MRNIAKIISDMKVPSITLIYKNGESITKEFTTVLNAKHYRQEQCKHLIKTPWNKILEVSYPEMSFISNPGDWLVRAFQANGETKNVIFTNKIDAFRYYNIKELKISSK